MFVLTISQRRILQTLNQFKAPLVGCLALYAFFLTLPLLMVWMHHAPMPWFTFAVQWTLAQGFLSSLFCMVMFLLLITDRPIVGTPSPVTMVPPVPVKRWDRGNLSCLTFFAGYSTGQIFLFYHQPAWSFLLAVDLFINLIFLFSSFICLGIYTQFIVNDCFVFWRQQLDSLEKKIQWDHEYLRDVVKDRLPPPETSPPPRTKRL